MKMRLSLLFIIVSLCMMYVRAVPNYYNTEFSADIDFLIKQKKIYNLLYHLTQPDIVYPHMYKEGQEYNIADNIDGYINQDAVNEFLELYKYGFLPRGELFSLLYSKLMNETKLLFKLFFYAKDFNTFYKTALWARVYINEGEFVCAFYQAVLRRSDTIFIQLPPLYEIYPFAFFNSEVMEAAKNIKLHNKNGTVDGNSFIIRANYSGRYLNRDYDNEMKLKYFIEDIGLNTYYFFLRQNNPFWLESQEFELDNLTRGEEYLYSHKQLYDRYHLERLANGLEKVEDFNWNREFYPGYYPTMVYHNGLPFPQRPHWRRIPHYKYKFLFAIQEIETRVSAAIDLGYIIDADGKQVNIYTPEGLNILGNIIEGNADSCNKNFYSSMDNIARRILGYNLEPKTPYQIIPSAMESFSSCMRDPAFYRLYNRVNQFYYRYKTHLKSYPKEDIIYPGLKFQSVAVDKLLTYFEDFNTTISHELLVSSQIEADTSFIKVRQQRLNHKPFTVHITLNSDMEQKVVIQLFLGPKYDAQNNLLDFTESYKYFYEMDYWITNVSAGNNKLERNSHDFYFCRPDDEPSEIFYERIEKALENKEKLTLKRNVYGFPERLILPKGSVSGDTYQLFVFVSPVQKSVEYQSRLFGNYPFNNRSMGYPLDRPIYRPNFDGPNMFFKDVTVYFKADMDATSYKYPLF